MATLKKYLLVMSNEKPASYVKEGELTQKMMDTSRLNTGNRVRLGKKLAECKEGGEFKIAFLGGAQNIENSVLDVIR